MATHYLITNREIIKGQTLQDNNYYRVNDSEFIRIDGSEEAVHNLRYGFVHFNDAASSLEDFELVFPEDITPQASEILQEQEEKMLTIKPGSFKVFNQLHEACSKNDDQNGHVLVYVHDSNTSLAKALLILKQLHKLFVVGQDGEKPMISHIVLFTWPSADKKLRFRNDDFDANRTGYAMARSFLTLRSFFKTLFKSNLQETGSKVKAQEATLCNKKIHLLCHASGCRVMESMLSSLEYLNQQPAAVFSEIILVGADLNYDCFEKPKAMYKAVDIGERVHVFYHNGDKDLDLSEKTKNALNSLGRWGIKDSMNIPDDLFEYDVTHIGDEGMHELYVAENTHHWYHLNSPAVVKDLQDIMAGKTSVFNM